MNPESMKAGDERNEEGGKKDKARVLVTVLLSVLLCYFGNLLLRKLSF